MLPTPVSSSVMTNVGATLSSVIDPLRVVLFPAKSVASILMAFAPCDKSLAPKVYV